MDGIVNEYQHDAIFHELQSKFYETGDPKYLWEAKPIIEHAIRSALRLYQAKATGSPDTWIPHWKDKVEEGSLYLISRCINGRRNIIQQPESKRGRPIEGKLITYCYWVAKLVMSSAQINREKQQEFEDGCDSYDNIDWSLSEEEDNDRSYIS